MAKIDIIPYGTKVELPRRDDLLLSPERSALTLYEVLSKYLRATVSEEEVRRGLSEVYASARDVSITRGKFTVVDLPREIRFSDVWIAHRKMVGTTEGALKTIPSDITVKDWLIINQIIENGELDELAPRLGWKFGVIPCADKWEERVSARRVVEPTGSNFDMSQRRQIELCEQYGRKLAYYLRMKFLTAFGSFITAMCEFLEGRNFLENSIYRTDYAPEWCESKIWRLGMEANPATGRLELIGTEHLGGQRNIGMLVTLEAW